MSVEYIIENLNDKNSNFKTLVYLAFYTGLRPYDMLSIRVEDIDLEEGELRYYSPKRKKHRAIAFHLELKPILQERINEVKKGNLLNYNSVENHGRAAVRYFKDLGIYDKGYTAKTFRKTFITLCKRLGMDSSIIAELVGHELKSTADRFYNNITLDVMKRELEKFNPPIKSSDERLLHQLLES